MTNPFSTGWEWQGKGRFLVFRSMERELWRAAFLPVEVVQKMDAWVEPYLPEPGVKKAPTVTPDWRAFGRLITDLSVPQLKWGGLLTYGDSTDFRSACRQSFRERMMEHVSGSRRQVASLRFLGSLSEKQWQKARTKGLWIGGDIPLATMEEWFRPRVDRRRGGVTTENRRLFWGDGAGFAKGDVLRVRGGQTEKSEWEEPQPTLELHVLRGEERRGRFIWRTRLELWPRPAESIKLPDDIS